MWPLGDDDSSSLEPQYAACVGIATWVQGIKLQLKTRARAQENCAAAQTQLTEANTPYTLASFSAWAIWQGTGWNAEAEAVWGRS